jgi:hypothetical protein
MRARPESYINLIGQLCYQKKGNANFLKSTALIKHAYLSPQAQRISAYKGKKESIL